MSWRHRRFPVSRLLLLVLCFALSLGLGGCTGGPPADDPPDEGDDGPPDEDFSPTQIKPGDLVPEEIVPMVHDVTGSAGIWEGATGYVYNEETREGVPGAKVVAQCQAEDLGLPTGPQVVETGDHGRFRFSAGGSLSGCDLVSYQALHPGLLQETVLTGPPLEPGEAYLVMIGLRPVE